VSIPFSLLCLILGFHKNASFRRPTYSFIHSFSCPLYLWGESREQQPQLAELRLLYRSVYQSLWSDFRRSWIPSQATWTSSPAAVYFRTLLEYTILGVLRDTISQFFSCWFDSFLLGCTQQKTDHMCAKDPVEKIHACSRLPTRQQKANGSSCSSQQWHLRRRVCDCLSNSFLPGLFKFLEEGHINYCTTVRESDILHNVIIMWFLSEYVTFYQINTFFVNISCFHYWQNVFCRRVKWLRRSDLAHGP